MNYGPRVRRIERRFPRPTTLDIGDGRSIVVSPRDLQEALFAVLEGRDDPIVEAIRSSEGKGRTGDPFAVLLRALEGDRSLISEDYVEPVIEPSEPPKKKPAPTYREQAAERFKEWKRERDRRIEAVENPDDSSGPAWFFEPEKPPQSFGSENRL